MSAETPPEQTRPGLYDPIAGEWREIEVIPVPEQSVLVIRLPDDTPSVEHMIIGEGLQRIVEHCKPHVLAGLVLAPGVAIEAMDEEQMRRIGWVRVPQE